MKMRLDFRLDLFVVALLLVVISNVHFKCQLALASSTNQKQQQQQQRQIGQQTGKHGPSVDRLAAILAAKPRPSGSSATQSAASQQQHQHKQQQQAQHTNNANNTTNQQAKLSSSASDLDLSKASVSSLPPASVAAGALAAARSTAKSQGKRQAGEFVDPNRSSSSAASRRNEDPWFLDQAPLPLQPYRFNYNVKDKNGLTEQYRQETGDGKFLTGSYGYVLPDGIFRHVDYVADDRGFRAFIRTSEPGTANQNPADVVINSSPVPGVGYVSPPSSTSGLANFGASSLLLGGQQQQQQQQSWADLQQPQKPRAAWNYTTFGPSPAFSSLNNLDLKRNLDTGSGVLPRRAPGSIVGTPLRNFSSFAYPFVPPVSSSLELNHPTQSSSYLTNLSQDQSPNTVGHTTFQSLSRFGDLQRLSQPSGSGNSGGGGSSSLSTTSNLTNFNTIGDDQRFNTHLTSTTGGTKSAHERDRSSSTTSSTGSSSFQGTGNYLGGGSAHLGGAAQDRQPSSGLLFAPQPLYHHRPGLLLPSRVGPDVLLYDRPFGVHQVSGSSGDGGSNKLSYDYNHILSRGDSSTPPYLAEERAKSLAYLEQLKALSRSNIPAPALVRPDLVSNELGTLVPFGGGPIGGQSAGQQTSSGVISGVNNELSTKTTSSSHHSEHHQEHKSTTSQVVDDLTRITLTREHKSGSSLGSGHDSGSTSTQQLPNSGEAQSSLLIPPPQPQFGNNNRDGQQRWATKGQQQQPQQQQQQLQFARLLAPYADEHQLGRRGGVKGAHEQQQQATSVSPVSGPDEPRSPSEPSSPTTTTIGASDSQSTRTTPADEIELNQTNAGTKTTPSQMGPAHGQHQVRLVRMPDNYRNSMMMNDLRSMQNALGLPQPPRLQRSSSASSPTTIDDAEQRLASGPISGPSTNLADHIVSARMSRVEALLNGAARDGAGGPISSQPVAPQQASIQRSVAVRAEKREQSSSPSELRLQEEANNKLDRASLLAMVLSKPFDNEIDDEDDQPRRSSSGGQSGSSGATQPTHHLHKQQQLSNSGSNQGNESSVFDAQRLRNSSNKARLRADKVSELEKFQQRLRTQQLLLEHVKQQQSTSDNNKASPAISTTNTLVNTLNSTPHRSQTTSPSKANTGGPTSTGVKVNEANSHVKYDEPPQENELLGSTLDEPTRSRRQNDIGETAPTNKTSLRKSSNGGEIIISSSPQLTTVTTRTPVTSEFARQLNQWPSLSAGLDRQRMSNSSSGNADSSTTSGGAPITFKAHKMDTAAPKQAAHLGSSSGQDGTVSNARRTLETPSTTTTTTANNTNTNNNGTRRDSPNTINLDFINSVTALSMDHLNPFAISSVNPAVQRSASSSANGERLSPHRLVMPGTSSVQQSQQQSEQSTGGANLLATAPARYFSSPELLAALNHHDRHDTGQRMRNLLSLEPQQFEQPANHRATTSSANSATGNPNAPYMMQPLAEQTETAAGTRSLNGLLGAKFIVAPTTASTSLMSEAANSQHKSVVPTPSPSSAGPGGESMGLIRQAATGGARSQLAARSVGLIQRDGFEIRDRAVQADNHRFYEVVSSLRQPSEQANGVNFQAFRDAQLSISANQK